MDSYTGSFAAARTAPGCVPVALVWLPRALPTLVTFPGSLLPLILEKGTPAVRLVRKVTGHRGARSPR